YQLAVLAIVGSTLGNLFLFSLARKGGEVYLERRTPSRGGALFRRWFNQYGLLTVFISALVPLPVMPMKIFVICSGALGANFWHFVATFCTARILRYTGLAYLGAQMGDGALVYLKDNALYLALFAATLFIVLVLLVKASDRFRKKRATGPA
ncbi:MAG: YqaA family protein, partial [Bryobacteraceae bacterium]